jgi:hypothetical protein
MFLIDAAIEFDMNWSLRIARTFNNNAIAVCIQVP